MKRIASVWLPNWPITSHRLRLGPTDARRPEVERPEAERPATAAPFALVVSIGGARRLAAVDEAAAALGLGVGKTLADALAREPGLRTADHDPEADLTALTRLADGCARFSPAVALDPPDGLFLDVSGAAHLWGGEAAMLEAVAARLGDWGVPARVALADTAGAAWALARFAAESRIAAPGAQGEVLPPLPVEALRLDAATTAGLRRLGLKTVGQAAGLPRAQLALRLGAALLLRLDQAFGRADEALTFRRPPTPWIERLAFAEPISAPADLARAIGDLADALALRLAGAGKGGRRFEAIFHRLDGAALAVRIGTALPSRDGGRLTRLFAPKLETVDPGFGIEAVTLATGHVEPLAERQGALGADPAGEADGLAALVDGLTNRLGEGRVWRAAPRESHTPERAVARVAPLGSAEGGWDPDRPRPVRLFRRPEPIEAVALVPDDPPLRFKWRGVSRRVRRAEGPERIAQEWWRDASTAPDVGRVRDYYAVEDEAGERFWLFRAGLHRPGEPARWWLHGLFG